MIDGTSTLPIREVIGEILDGLQSADELVLEAPPGAGKTTLVPLILMGEDWLGDQKILLLEPRRLAARSAAHRMASLLGENVGETVGYRMRLDTRVGPNTRIEVITEGVLTRMLQQDPSLEGVGLVIFDEFHERNLESDLGLALCMQGRDLFRDEGAPLKILVMSATLDGEALASMLRARVIRSEGRSFPVEIIHGKASQHRDRIVERVVATVNQVVRDNPGDSLLVFLPGQGEINRCLNALRQSLPPDIRLCPLYGSLSLDDQQRAIEPGQRKVVLATNIAETSLTIEGVNVVVDSGLAREPAFDPNNGMTRLETRRISRSSSVQRAGRAGRLAPGRCYRLWSREQQQQLAPQRSPEILNADLAPLCLQLLQWGVSEPGILSWLDKPPRGPWLQAVDLLKSLAAVSVSEQGIALTGHGKRLVELSTHPRLAHMLLAGHDLGLTDTVCLLAAVLSDRDPIGRDNPDMAYRLSLLYGELAVPGQYRGWVQRTRTQADRFRKQLRGLGSQTSAPTDLLSAEQATGYLLACAYPDRIARKRHGGAWQLANGRSAQMPQHSLSKSRWLAVAEVGGLARQKGDSIYCAASLDADLFQSLLLDLVIEDDSVEWDEKADRFVAERRTRIGELVIRRENLSDISVEMRVGAVLKMIRRRGLDVLPFTAEVRQWQSRVLLLHELNKSDEGAANPWPDISNEMLMTKLESWLGPFLGDVKRKSDLKKLDLASALSALLTWPQTAELDKSVPSRYQVPSGSRISINYNQRPPVLAVKLQEMFGVRDAPAVARGKIKLQVQLLSPAGRPLQVTQDLAAFWQNSYDDVKKEMRGRYPKHPWPDDPMTAEPTRATNRALRDKL